MGSSRWAGIQTTSPDPNVATDSSSSYDITVGNPLQADHRLQFAIEWVYAEGRHLTPDVGGSASTAEFTDAVIRRLTKE